MKQCVILVTVVVALAAVPPTGLAQTAPRAPQPLEAEPGLMPGPGYKLAWSDEFSGSELDKTKWDYDHYHKNTVPNAVTVANGCLTITAYTENGKHFGGIICTLGKFEGKFGYFEARIKFADSAGTSSAFWLASPTNGKPIGDPATAGMEIDISEHRARSASGKNIADKTSQGVQWDGYGNLHKSKGQLTDDLGLASGFHTYGLEWTENGYRFYVDGKLTWTAPTPVSKHPEYILLHTLVEPGYAGTVPAGGSGSRETSTTKMVVKYVKYYERVDSGASVP
jgi:beta-glucanase (GH16 family)